MRLSPIFAVLACTIGCGPENAPAGSGEPADFTVSVPDLDAMADDDTASKASPWPDPPGTKPESVYTEPMVERGIWEMHVGTVNGNPCWEDVESGVTINIIIESDGAEMMLMDLVTLEAQGQSRAWGVGSESFEIAPDCLQTDVMFASAELEGPTSFTARIEHERTFGGEGCPSIQGPDMECRGGWTAQMEWVAPGEAQANQP